jgi:stage III sporulation protein SpoIIIAA
MQQQITSDIELFIAVMPPYIQQAIAQVDHVENLIEVVLDLGRKPEARFTTDEVVLAEREVELSDIDYVVDHVGQFMGDNRAGIERTLHRISAIRNRQNRIIGVTCRVGRAVYGTIDIIQDLLETDQSVLILGPPGIGKTTLLRESARILAATKRVVIVDTSNEIAGDGDIPHHAIGRARRLQVPKTELQHQVMIEAVENHTPQVIIVDEIGRIEEAEAARTIAERGVQLVATAHGGSLANLTSNPTLADLVGGIDSVTLSDEEARRRSSQKTVLERRSPPTFEILVEIQTRDRFAVHYSMAKSVDALLRGRPVNVEVRERDDSGEIKIELGQSRRLNEDLSEDKAKFQYGNRRHLPTTPKETNETVEVAHDEPEPFDEEEDIKPLSVFALGADYGRLRHTARMLNVPLLIVKELNDANAVITLKNQYRKRADLIGQIEQRGIPLYVLRSNTVNQMETCLVDLFSLPNRKYDPFTNALDEAQVAIRKVMQGARSISLKPQEAAVRRRQHELARKANLISHSFGQEPQRRVKIYRQ